MSATAPTATFRPLCLFLAVLLPGLGHIVGREVARGLCVFSGVMFLFFGGIFVGGIDVIDSREDRIWFVGQALVGPVAFGVDYIHQNRFKVIDPVTRELRSAYPNEGRDPKTRMAVAGGTPPNKKSLAKMNELGTLFATIAGMINLIVIIDAGFPSARTGAAGTRKPKDGLAAHAAVEAAAAVAGSQP